VAAFGKLSFVRFRAPAGSHLWIIKFKETVNYVGL
jgi:hypothetical protein